MELRHPVSSWALTADNDNHVSIQFTRLKGSLHVVFVVKHHAWGLYNVPFGVNRRSLDDCLTEVTGQMYEPACFLKRGTNRP